MNDEQTPTSEETPNVEETAPETLSAAYDVATMETGEETAEETLPETGEGETGEEETAEETGAIVPVAEEEIQDGSRIMDAEKIASIQASIRERLGQGVTAYRGMTNVVKDVARLRVEARSLIILPNGHPDWSAKSDAYRLTIAAAEQGVWDGRNVGQAEKRRIDQTVRQHVNRTYVEQGIVAYVRLKVADVPETDESFRSAVRAEYEAAELTVPPKWKRADAPDGGGGGGGGGGGEGSQLANPAADLATALGKASGSLPKIAHLNVVVGLHRLSSDEGKRLQTAKMTEIADREAVKTEWANLARVAVGIATMLDGKLDETGEAALLAAYYDPAKHPKV